MVTHALVSTQQRHPWRAVKRTVAQVLGASATLAAAAQFLTWLGEQVPTLSFLPAGTSGAILAAGTALSGAAGALARITAIPGVDEWLTKLGLSSTPKPDAGVPEVQA